ncbi:MAG: glutamate-1-semialdehyde 2,1-aminomutase [Dehalococcoidia bacterium]
MKNERSRELFEEALKILPGGVDSPVRAFGAVGGGPLFIERGRGSRVYDADGNEYLDYVLSWGPLILGHAHPRVVASLRAAAGRGTSFGAPTELETTLGRLITSALPSMELIRFVNSGTEATMSALRLARAFTGRERVVKFAGGYHGHADGLLVQGGSGLATLSIPSSPGVPQAVAELTLVAPYNDLPAVARLFQAYPRDIAAVIVEPVAANMGVVPPEPGFLQGLRRLTGDSGSLLIFDEVITGFRLAYGGAQGLYGIAPDLTCLGKIIGGGLPVGAYGGRGEIMEMMAPSGPVYQAGTLSGNPLAMTAGIETLKALSRRGVYGKLEAGAERLARGLQDAAQREGISMSLNRAGSMLTAFFLTGAVTSFEGARAADTGRYRSFFRGMLEGGVYLPPSQFEALFLSLAHSREDIEATIRAAAGAFSRLEAEAG